MGKWILKGIFPLVLFLLLFFVMKKVYCVNGEIDYFRLWLVMGMPFGLLYFGIWLLPYGFDLGAMMGILALDIVISGILGGFVAIISLGKAFYYLIIYPMDYLCREGR